MMSDDLSLPRPRMAGRNWFWEIINTLFFIVAAYTLLQMAIPRSVVHGQSMEPSFAEGQYLLISRVNYLFSRPQRGDIVVFNPPTNRPDDPSLIKRVIGIPGDVIEFREGELYLNGELQVEPYINEPCTVRCRSGSWELGTDEYFVMGDNRNHSNDSRAFNAITYDHIIGEVLLRYWPPRDMGVVERYRFQTGE